MSFGGRGAKPRDYPNDYPPLHSEGDKQYDYHIERIEITHPMTTHTQYRATCPACFATQALTSRGLLVAHGYKRPQHWNANVGTCSGAGHSHFGTEAGRNYTIEVARRLRTGAAVTTERAAAVRSGSSPVEARKRVAAGVYQMALVDNPSTADRERFAVALTQTAAAMIAQANELDALVAAWTPREPVAVAAVSKVPLVHWRTERRWRGEGKACAGSMMGAHKGHATRAIEHVTCEKCKAIAARYEAPAVVAEVK